MRVEPAEFEDCHAIAEVHVASWQQAYVGIVPNEYLAGLSVSAREASWQEAIRAGTPGVLVARHQSNVVGFVAYGPSRDQDALANCNEVWALYVLSSSWSAGVGRALWLAALERFRLQGISNIVTLWVLSANMRGRRFYTAAGFVPELASEKEFSLGGASLREIRLVFRDVV
jgi:GNAT superfamily N-acetyltransferase